MGRVGAQLGLVQNLTNRWFVVHGAMGVNLLEEFVGQPWAEVKVGLERLGDEGVRERVPVSRKRAYVALERVMAILSERGEEVREMLEAWVGEEGLLDRATGP